jgi:Flp pilus assembly protein TadG
VEFALLIVPFLLMMFALLEMGFQVFLASDFDTAVRNESRAMQIGTAQVQRLNSAQFRQRICDRLSVAYDCNKIAVDVRVLTWWSSAVAEAWDGDFEKYAHLKAPFADNSKNQFCMGVDNKITLVRAMIEIPVFSGFWLPKKIKAGDQMIYAMVSNHLFRVEPYGGTATSGDCA